MPEVTVRKRIGRRSGSLRYRLHRWVFYRRTAIALTVAAIVAAAAALVLWTALSNANVTLDTPDVPGPSF